MIKIKTKRILCFMLLLGIVLASVNTGFTSYASSDEYVFVLSKVTYPGKSKDYKSYSYNKDGLMKAEKSVTPETDSTVTTTYVYSDGRMTSSKILTGSHGSFSTYTTEYTYDSKKRLKKSVCVDPDDNIVIQKFEYNKKNQKIKETTIDKGNSQKNVVKYKYNSKGQLIKKFNVDKTSVFVSDEYKYNSKGYVSSVISTFSIDGVKHTSTLKRKITMKNGRLAKISDEYVNEDNKVTDSLTKIYTYKKIKINKKYKKQIKKQQAELIFDNTI